MLRVNMNNGEVGVFTGRVNVVVKEDHTVSLNGELEIQAGPDGNGYTLSYPDAFGSFALRYKSTPGNGISTFKSVVGVEYDPYVYKNSDNGLSVGESTQRAYGRVTEDMVPYEWIRDFGTAGIWDAIKKKIRNGDGRQSVYMLVGGIIKGYKNGMYKGVPFGYILQGFVDGVLEAPTPINSNNINTTTTSNRWWWDR